MLCNLSDFVKVVLLLDSVYSKVKTLPKPIAKECYQYITFYQTVIT